MAPLHRAPRCPRPRARSSSHGLLRRTKVLFNTTNMDRLEQAERRFDEAVARVEAALLASSRSREKVQQGLALADSIEERATSALKSVRDLMRQQEGH